MGQIDTVKTDDRESSVRYPLINAYVIAIKSDDYIDRRVVNLISPEYLVIGPGIWDCTWWEKHVT